MATRMREHPLRREAYCASIAASRSTNFAGSTPARSARAPRQRLRRSCLRVGGAGGPDRRSLDRRSLDRRSLDRVGGRAHVLPMLILTRRGFVALAAGAAVARPLPALAAPVRLLAFGDSLIHGYGLPPDESLPAQLEAALRAAGEDVTVINGGNSGDTTASGLSRLQWTLAGGADAVLLSLGSNDGLRGLEPAETEKNLRAMLEILRAAKLPVLLAGMYAPRNLGQDYAAEFDAIYPRLAAEYDTLFYPFLLQGVALEPALNQADGIHPNAEGVAMIVAGLLPEAQRLVQEARASTTQG
jgi:acyl-CoA thioesterase-1